MARTKAERESQHVARMQRHEDAVSKHDASDHDGKRATIISLVQADVQEFLASCQNATKEEILDELKFVAGTLGASIKNLGKHLGGK